MKFHARPLLALLCVFAFAPYASAQFGSAPAELELIKLKDDLYVIHNANVPGNSTALITDEGVILVDDKFEIDLDNILRLLATVTDQPVKYVINTHFHGDHSGGNARLQAAGSIAIASENARIRMVDGNQPGLPDFTVEQRGHLYLGGKSAEIYWFGRSHTDGDIVVLFPEDRVLAAGDMVTIGMSTPQLIDYGGGGSAAEWTATVDKVLELDFDTFVPGHGDVSSKQAMREFRESTVRLRNLVSDLVRQNKSRDEIEAAMRSEFGWQDLHVNRGLDGLIDESRR
jgi:glyoxylase-like metal-dependent hydrolase (beta-lactamase superfamily II)